MSKYHMDLSAIFLSYISYLFNSHFTSKDTKSGPKIRSIMVQIPLAPLGKRVHIHWSSILRCPEVVKDGMGSKEEVEVLRFIFFLHVHF